MNKTTTIKTKLMAGILAAVTACSVSTMAMTVHAAEPDISAGTTITDDLKITMDSDLMAVTKLTSSTIFKVLEECTPYGKFFTPALGVLLDTFLGTPEDPTQQKLDEINDKLDKLFDKIDAAEKSMKTAIETDLGLQSFYEAFVRFESQTENMNRKISSIMQETNLSNADKMAKIGSLTGAYSEWRNDFEDLHGELSKLYRQPSMTAAGNIFELIYSHYCNGVMFSGEALDLAKPIADHIMQVYAAGCSTLVESLSAQLYVNHLSSEMQATINPEYMAHIDKDTNDIENEITSIMEPLVGKGVERKSSTSSKWMGVDDRPSTIIKTLDKSGTIKALYDTTFNKSRTILVDKGHTDLRLSKYFITHDHKSEPYGDGHYYSNEAELAANYFNKYFGNGQINADYVRDIANYAKSKGVSIRTLLNRVGFSTEGVPQNANLITSGAWKDVTNTAKSLFGLYCYQKTFYKGFNIDAINPGENTIQVLDCGYNTWKGNQEWNFLKAGCACRFEAL